MPNPRVLADWGMTRLRLFLLDNQNIVDSREGRGMGQLQDSALSTLVEAVRPWMHEVDSLRVTVCGMAGFSRGLFEVPHVPVPVSCEQWSRMARSADMCGMEITIAAGLKDMSQNAVADVMRGEETQVFGAMHLHSQYSTGSHLFVLPGTHSKWVEICDGSIVRFQTALTGEMYALLRKHSTLLGVGAAQKSDGEDTDAGFIAGVERCAQVRAGLLTALFEARTAQLLDSRSSEWAAGFLSGLLIAYEIATLRAVFNLTRGVTIVSEPRLAAWYRRVFVLQGVDTSVFNGDACVIAGLRHLRQSRSENGCESER